MKRLFLILALAVLPLCVHAIGVDDGLRLSADPQDDNEQTSFNIKTNLAYDALMVPNIGVDFALGTNWSVGANVMYAWWDNKEKYKYWRVFGGDLNFRYWFGGNTGFRGHHLGFYGQVLTFDLENGNRGIMIGSPGYHVWKKPMYGAGFEYGYSLRLHRHWNIDFTLGLGYINGDAYKYAPAEEGGFQITRRKTVNWFGPTKAEISISYHL